MTHAHYGKSCPVGKVLMSAGNSGNLANSNVTVENRYRKPSHLSALSQSFLDQLGFFVQE